MSRLLMSFFDSKYVVMTGRYLWLQPFNASFLDMALLGVSLIFCIVCVEVHFESHENPLAFTMYFERCDVGEG